MLPAADCVDFFYDTLAIQSYSQIMIRMSKITSERHSLFFVPLPYSGGDWIPTDMISDRMTYADSKSGLNHLHALLNI